MQGVSSELESSITGGLLCLLSLDSTTGESLCPQLLVLVEEALGEDEVNFLESSITSGLLCLLSLDSITGESLCPQLLVLVEEVLGEDGVNGFGLRGLRVVRLVHELSDGERSLYLLDVPS